MATTKVSPGETDQPPEYAQPGPQYGQPGPQYGQPGPQYGQPIIHQPTTTNTTVILQQPTVEVNKSTKRMWNSGIFGCFDDMSSSLIVGLLCFVGCIECYGDHLASRMKESCFLGKFVPGYLIALRTKLRVEQNIQGNICDDCIVTSCCRPCAMCQMSRELDYCD